MAGLSRKAQRAALLGASGSLRHSAASHSLPRCNCWEAKPSKNSSKYLILLVPVERIELPTFGLQNRCSTAELNRRIESGLAGQQNTPLYPSIFGGPNTRLARKGPEPQRPLQRGSMDKKATPIASKQKQEPGSEPGSWPPFAVFRSRRPIGRGASGHPRPGTRCRGCRRSRCGGDIHHRRSGAGNGCGRADRATDYAGCDITGPEAAIVVPAVIAVAPSAVLIGLIAIDLPLIARPPDLAIAVSIVLRAIARIVGDVLRQGGGCQRGGEDGGGENS